MPDESNLAQISGSAESAAVKIRATAFGQACDLSVPVVVPAVKRIRLRQIAGTDRRARPAGDDVKVDFEQVRSSIAFGVSSSTHPLTSSKNRLGSG